MPQSGIEKNCLIVPDYFSHKKGPNDLERKGPILKLILWAIQPAHLQDIVYFFGSIEGAPKHTQRTASGRNVCPNAYA